MDGFKPTDNICILASTNRIDVLDKALLRAGRFDRQISVDLPDLQGRMDIAQIYLKRIRLHEGREQMAKRIAEITPGLTGADISNIVNEGALLAVRRGAVEVYEEDLLNACDRVLCGFKKEKRGLTPREIERVAYHEAGHALVGWLTPHSEPCLKVTIIPRTNGALGFTQHLPKELAMYSEAELKAMLQVLMGGRAAERICLGDVTTGSRDDLKKASAVANEMVTEYGFSDKVGPVCYTAGNDENMPTSESLLHVIEDEKKRLIEEAFENAMRVIEKNKEKMSQIANMLLEKETITNVDLESVLGKRMD